MLDEDIPVDFVLQAMRLRHLLVLAKSAEAPTPSSTPSRRGSMTNAFLAPSSELWTGSFPRHPSEQADALVEITRQHGMVKFYEQCSEQFERCSFWPPRDEEFVSSMQKANEARLIEIEDRIRDAEENLGESEVREGFLAKAVFFYEIFDVERALEAFAEAEKKTVAVGQKLDMVFYLLRLALATENFQMVDEQIRQAKKLLEQGGDWDKRNRLRAYEGVYRIMRRDFNGAAELLVNVLATFTSFELMDMRTFVMYACVASSIAFSRVPLKDQVIESPEVIAFCVKIPHLENFINDLYNCQYASFLRCLANIADEVLRADVFLGPHVQFICRELRIRAYTQFLEPYRTVSLASFANAFGVSEDYADREISRFIAMRRLACKVDKVADVIETRHGQSKDQAFSQVIRRGDLVLNRLSRLARVVEL